MDSEELLRKAMGRNDVIVPGSLVAAMRAQRPTLSGNTVIGQFYACSLPYLRAREPSLNGQSLVCGDCSLGVAPLSKGMSEGAHGLNGDWGNREG